MNKILHAVSYTYPRNNKFGKSFDFKAIRETLAECRRTDDSKPEQTIGGLDVVLMSNMLLNGRKNSISDYRPDKALGRGIWFGLRRMSLFP